MRYLLCLPLLFLCACQEEEVETPETRVAFFLNAFWEGNAEGIWSSLDRPTQEAIAEVAGLDPDAKDTPARAFLLNRFRALSAIEPLTPSIDRLPSTTRATVEVRSSTGEAMTFHLVKKGEKWLINLLPLEGQSPTSEPTSEPASEPATAPSSTSLPASRPASAP